MDAHYSKVMKAREDVTEQGTKLYFAYSGVLDKEAFNQWRLEHSYEFFNLPEGQVVSAEGIDLIFDFPSRWWGGRVAGLVDKPGSSVFGLLFEIPVKDWPVVQHKEGVVTGMSIERVVKVKSGDREIEAIAFTTAPARSSILGPVSEDYIQALVRGAKQACLPEDYIASLPARGN
jgi:hypothetical protein